MAAIRKRGPYQWEAQIRKRGYPAQSKTFNTKTEAEAWVRAIEGEMDRNAWVSRAEAESTTLHQALQRYEKEVSPTKRGGMTRESSVLRILRDEDMATRPMAAIRGSDVAALRDAWLREYQPATVLRRLSVLSHVFNVARKEWGMESLSNPVELVRKPRADNARTRRVSVVANADSGQGTHEGEIERIIAASESPLLPSIITLAIETAMRRGEIVGLRWEHVDLHRYVAHLPETKNGSARDVPLSPRAAEVLQALKDARADTDISLVFPIREDAVTRAFERALTRARAAYVTACKGAGQRPDGRFLTDLRFHDLRHEATSRLASIFPLHELTKITGHKDPRMLMRYYHPRAEDLAKRLRGSPAAGSVPGP